MLKTAECVTPMHPDKICDRISDAILDACLEQDPESRVAIETMGGHGIITITGELTTKAYVDMREIARGIVGDKYGVQINVVQQSKEISSGVDTGGAGDQGIMIGYACADNDSMIPHELHTARELCKAIYKKYPYDGKTQVTMDDRMLLTIVASFQNTTKEQLEDVIEEVFPGFGGTLHLNPAGDWNIGGFEADTGVTGRKLAVDNYGPQVPIGGGAFSGKDYTKVDRTGAYYARKLAVTYLQETNAKEVIVKLAFAIGVNKPVMVTVLIDGTKVETPNIITVNDMIELLELKKPQYKRTAEWGHFGNGFTWDR